jgi:hypothetical protein
MGRQGVKVSFLIFLLLILVAGAVVYFQETSGKESTVDFKPVYLSNVSLGISFSNEGPDLLVVNFSDIGKLTVEENKPTLVVGNVNVTRLMRSLNISASIVPLNASPEAVIVYNGKLILLNSGKLGDFLSWVRWVIAHESHWSFGIYSGYSGVLLSSRLVTEKTSNGNWTSVGGEVHRRQVIIDIVAPGKEKTEFFLTPTNGKLLDYYPTTSKLKGVTIHDRSDFSMNLAGWIVEKTENKDANLRAIIGIESGNLNIRYSLNGTEGLLRIVCGS